MSRNATAKIPQVKFIDKTSIDDEREINTLHSDISTPEEKMAPANHHNIQKLRLNSMHYINSYRSNLSNESINNMTSKQTKANQMGSSLYYFSISPLEEHQSRLTFIRQRLTSVQRKSRQIVEEAQRQNKVYISHLDYVGYGTERSKSVINSYKKTKRQIKPAVRLLPESNFKERLASVMAKKSSNQSSPLKNNHQVSYIRSISTPAKHVYETQPKNKQIKDESRLLAQLSSRLMKKMEDKQQILYPSLDKQRNILQSYLNINNNSTQEESTIENQEQQHAKQYAKKSELGLRELINSKMFQNKVSIKSQRVATLDVDKMRKQEYMNKVYQQEPTTLPKLDAEEINTLRKRLKLEPTDFNEWRQKRVMKDQIQYKEIEDFVHVMNKLKRMELGHKGFSKFTADQPPNYTQYGNWQKHYKRNSLQEMEGW